jgi:hypothetical protein
MREWKILYMSFGYFVKKSARPAVKNIFLTCLFGRGHIQKTVGNSGSGEKFEMLWRRAPPPAPQA